MKRTLILTMVVLALALPSQALVPETMNVQGVLTNDAGVVLPDGDYEVFFQFWDAAVEGSDSWGETQTIHQTDGMFNAILGNHSSGGIPPGEFSQKVWLSIRIEGEAPMEPRLELTTSPYAFRAARVDPNAAVRKLNGMTNNVLLLGGANVTITQVDTTIVISASGSGSAWEINGNNISYELGNVGIGTNTPEYPLHVVTDEERAIYGENTATSGAAYGVYGSSASPVGRGLWGIATSSSGITYGVYGRSCGDEGRAVYGNATAPSGITFGVSGQSWSSTGRGVKGLASAAEGINYGVYGQTYSPDGFAGYFRGGKNYFEGNVGIGIQNPSAKLHIGGTPNVDGIMFPDGTLQKTAAGGSGADDDWTISGDNMFNSRIGATAIGTSYPHPYREISGNTTLQVSSSGNPTLALDRTYPALTRWTMSQNSGGIIFNKSDDYTSAGTTAMSLDAGMLEVNRWDGELGIRLQGEGVEESGSRLDVYGTSAYTTLPMVSLDSEGGSSNIGGRIDLRNGYGEYEVILNANHNGTNVGRVTTPVLEITGGSDLSEQFDIGEFSELTKPGMVVSIDPENAGQLTLSGKAYDRRVAGVISGAGGVNTGMVMGQRGSVADGDLPVALVGRVYVWADASNGPIEPGDLLTSSDLPGHAMKVEDHGRAMGAILGKAMTGLTEGQGLILTLVSLQ